MAKAQVELREVKLANKPPELIAASPKATVPVLDFRDGSVIEESIAIMRWALHQNDPEGWLSGDDLELIAEADGPFKHHLDRYKYPNRYEDEPGFGEVDHQAEGYKILRQWNDRLAKNGQLTGSARTMADIALFPFVRQFANHDRAWFDAQDLAHLQNWLAGHLDSALFKAIMPKFTPWQSGDAPIAFGPQASTDLENFLPITAKTMGMQTLVPDYYVKRIETPREIHWAASGLLDEAKLNELFSTLLTTSKPFRDDKKGFRVLGDLREFAVQPREIAALIEQSQQASAQYGVDRMAILCTSMLVKQQFRRVSDSLECEFFDTKGDALAWIRS